MNRLQTRIFGFFVLLLIAVQAFSFWMAYYSYNKLEKQQLDNRMSVAEKVFRSEFDNRNHYLSIFAETAAKDFGLKEIFIDGEQKSFLIALNNHRGRIGANMAMAISKDGKVIGQLVNEMNDAGKSKVKIGSEQGTHTALMLEQSMADFDSLYRLDGKIYQLRFATLKSGSTTIGWVGFGFVVDSNLASLMEDQTGLPTGFALSSELTPPQFLAHSGIDIASNIKAVLGSFLQKGTENEDYLLWSLPLGQLGNQSLYAYMYLPRADVLKALQKQWWRQLWLVLLMLPVSLFAAFGISGSITKPIMRLIEQAKFIAQGNYDAKVKPSSTLELAQLAHEFTEMQTAILSREKKIVHQAFHDTLTNLPNRNELERLVSEWIQNGSHVIVCLLNIRRLTDVNVTLGHMVGDEVIKEVGHRLENMNNVDLVCRLSGDEYALALKDFDDVGISTLLQRIQLQMAKRYCYQDVSLHLQLTVGVSILKSNLGLSQLLQQANTAMQHAKANKLDFVIYDPKIDQHTLETFELVNALTSAIENNELVLFYQPKLCLEKKKVVQVEALVRWLHPQKGTIPPDVFIPIAEKTGQMNTLSRWVIIAAIKQYHKWRSEGIELSIAVNISAENLKDSEFCQWLLNTVEQLKMPVSALTLEITEDAVVEDPESAIMQLSHWRDRGLKLSIDDFGTGYSSLGQLKQLPVHEIKIDRSFIQHLMSNDEDKIIVNSTLELAHNLGLSVVAEGVENLETLEWLTEHNCEMAQGFYLSRPIPEDELAQWLLSSHFSYIKPKIH
ncbi:EAL domain-containing protein [Parashewanella spongiae]|nr:EAL domain-containing protein [Parashewanella spongiae]MCL1079186.1 EAL domain-containing protein [Parashewanella spongiae]